MGENRCGWELSSEKMKAYHDHRWCKPEHDDQELFAMLILEGAQAGLSWSTIINREENYREAFDGFDPKIVASYDAAKMEELMQNAGIIRNRRKIEAAVLNAQAFLKIQKESELSERVSKDLKKRGFRFVGPTIIYSYLQGIGIYNDHLENCDFR